MKTLLKFTLSLVSIISINSFAQHVSIGRAPVNNDVKHSINYGNHIAGSTIGYGADPNIGGWYSVDIPSSSLTLIGGGTFHMGGDFDSSGTFYATRSLSTLIIVDPATGTETVVDSITGVPEGQRITSMAWDATTNTMFLGSTDLAIHQSLLFTINLATGVATLVGTIGQRGLIALACNCGGELYSIDLADSLWSIDKNTGVGTAIGNLGYNVNYAQDADFNPADTVLYLAAYNNTTYTGQLRTVDLTTGNSTLLMDWGSTQITDFGIVGSGPPVPVELTSFRADVNDGSVVLNWQTATETHNQMFEIQRRISDNDQNGEWITIGYREGKGITTEPQNYTYDDDISGMDVTSLTYRLKQIDFDGSYSFSEEVLVNNLAPNGFVLEQNYPNPFNPKTSIKYAIGTRQFITLKIYDVLGNEIETLVNEEKPAGSYEFIFDASDLSSGIYFYKLQAGTYVETKKMVLLK